MAAKRTTRRSRQQPTRRTGSRKTSRTPTGARAPRGRARAARGPASAAARDRALKEDVLHLLQGRGAHVEFERAVAGMPADLQGRKPVGVPYTPWQQLEHLRICQRDILDYVRDPHYVERNWPDDYWPDETPPSPGAWDDAVRAFEADRRAFLDLVAKADLLARVPHDPKGPTILHEALLVADHNAYHLGQLMVLRRALGTWTD